MPCKVECDVAIIGAGIAGLTTAFYLKNVGYRVAVIERSHRAGGRIETIQKDDFLLELGPHTIYGKEEVVSLATDLGIDTQIERAYNGHDARRHIAISRGRNNNQVLHPLPTSLAEVYKSKLLSPWAKCRIALEPLTSHRTQSDESVRTFMTRRFGSEITDNIIATLLTGIWAGDISQLSCRHTLPRVWSYAQRFGSVTRGIKKDYAKTPNERPQALNFRRGMETLPRSLAHAIGEETIHYLHTPGEITTTAHGVTIAATQSLETPSHTNVHPLHREKEFHAHALVITTPAYAAAELISRFGPSLSTLLSAIPYAPLGTLHVAYPEEHLSRPLNFSGFLCPPRTDRTLVGAINTSKIYPSRTQKGYALLTAFTGGTWNRYATNVADRAVQENAIKELNDLIGATERPKVLHTSTHSRALPNYALGHGALKGAITDFHTIHPRIRLVGNWLDGVGVPHRIAHARSTVGELLELLPPPQTSANEKIYANSR